MIMELLLFFKKGSATFTRTPTKEMWTLGDDVSGRRKWTLATDFATTGQE